MHKPGPSLLARRVGDFRKRQVALPSEGNGVSLFAVGAAFPEYSGRSLHPGCGVTALHPVKEERVAQRSTQMSV